MQKVLAHNQTVAHNKKIVLKTKYIFKLIIPFLFITLTKCNSVKKEKQKIEPYISKVNLTENVSDFTSEMTEKDTIKILAELSMERWIREDELILTKKNNEIYLQVIIKEDTTFEGKYQMRTNRLTEIKIENSNNYFEKYFAGKLERTKVNSPKSLFYIIISQNDTLTFFTNVNLGDIGKEVDDYLKFMSIYYPNEMEFHPFENPENIEGFKNVD